MGGQCGKEACIRLMFAFFFYNCVRVNAPLMFDGGDGTTNIVFTLWPQKKRNLCLKLAVLVLVSLLNIAWCFVKILVDVDVFDVYVLGVGGSMVLDVESKEANGRQPSLKRVV